MPHIVSLTSLSWRPLTRPRSRETFRSSTAIRGRRFSRSSPFLGLNDIDFLADEAEAVVMISGLAGGEIDETGLARWIRDNWPAD